MKMMPANSPRSHNHGKEGPIPNPEKKPTISFCFELLSMTLITCVCVWVFTV